MRRGRLRYSLIWLTGYPILSRMRKLHNRHRDAECYIFGDGPSIAHFDLLQFSDKIGIGVNAFPRHKDAGQTKLKYWVVAEPAMFYPPIIRTFFNRGGNLRWRLQIRRFYSPPVSGLDDLTHVISFWNFPFRFRRSTQYFLDRFPHPSRKSTDRSFAESFDGSINAAISLAIYLGFSRAYLVGFDYTHDPPAGGHWYDINDGDVRPNLHGYNWSYFDQVGPSIELVTVTVTEQNTYLKSITYSTLTGRAPVKKQNREMLKHEDLKTLSMHYQVYESQRFVEKYRHITKGMLISSLVRTLAREQKFKRVNRLICREISAKQTGENLLVERCLALADAWKLERISHHDSTIGIKETLGDLDLTGVRFLELSALYEGLLHKGLFSAALEVLRKQCDLVLLKEGVGSPTYFRSALVSIYQGDSQSAYEKLSSEPKYLFDVSRSRTAIHTDVLSFLKVCDDKERALLGIGSVEVNRRFWLFAKERECLLAGPGTSALEASSTTGNAVRAQIMKKGIGATFEDAPSETEQPSVVYLSSETAQWLVRNSRTALLDNYNFAVFKDHAEYLINRYAIRNGRSVPFMPGLSTLFWSGTSGMGLIAILDSMSAPYCHVSASGFDLYATEHEYRPSIQKELVSMNRTTSGASGAPFYRCHALSEHSPFVNRWLLQALRRSRRFHPDATLDRVLKMTDDEYATTLDQLHGAKRR